MWGVCGIGVPWTLMEVTGGSQVLQQGNVETRSVPEAAFGGYGHSLKASESQRVIAGSVCVVFIAHHGQNMGSDTHWEA